MRLEAAGVLRNLAIGSAPRAAAILAAGAAELLIDQLASADAGCVQVIHHNPNRTLILGLILTLTLTLTAELLIDQLASADAGCVQVPLHPNPNPNPSSSPNPNPNPNGGAADRTFSEHRLRLRAGV